VSEFYPNVNVNSLMLNTNFSVTQYDAQKTKHPVKSRAKNVQSDRLPFKFQSLVDYTGLDILCCKLEVICSGT